MNYFLIESSIKLIFSDLDPIFHNFADIKAL